MEENNNLNVDSYYKTIKFKKKRTIFLACIFILIILITIFLLFFKNDLFKKEVKNDSNVNTNEEVKKTEDELLVEELLSSEIPYVWTWDINSKLYSNSLVTFDELNQEGVIGIAIRSVDSSKYLSFDETNIEETKIRSDLASNISSNLMNDASMIIPMGDIVNEIKNKYAIENYDINKYEEITKYDKYFKFNISGGVAYIYDNYLFLMYGKGDIGKEKITLDYTFQKTGNDLYIYEKMFIPEYGAFTDDNKTNCYINQIDSKVKSIAYSELLTDDEHEAEIINACSPYAKTYKHVFKLNDSGEYYWYSTEPYEA